MSNLVYSFIDLPIFTTGRRRYALGQVLELARDSTAGGKNGDAALVALVEQAIQHEEATWQKEDAWRRSRNTSAARGEAAARDLEVDRIISALAGHLETALAIKDGSGEYQAARKLYGQLYPEGVAPIINQPYEDQLAANDGLMLKLTTTLKNEAQTLNLGRFVEALGRANEAFRVELNKAAKVEISYDQVQAARDRGNLNLRMTVARILGASAELTPEAEAQRATLLAPILEQARRIRAARRGRRRVGDVDPTTGEDLVDAPVAGPSVDEA